MNPKSSNRVTNIATTPDAFFPGSRWFDGHPCHHVLMLDGRLRDYRECAGQGRRVNQQTPEQILPPPPEAICEPTFFQRKKHDGKAGKATAITTPCVNNICAFLPRPFPKSPVLLQVSLRKNQLRACFTLCQELW